MTDELKKAMESAKTDEEKMAVAERFRDELQQLSDEELEEVAGGVAVQYFRARRALPEAQARVIHESTAGWQY